MSLAKRLGKIIGVVVGETIDEAVTYHGNDGRFTSQRSAHTVTKGGERFKMVRQLRRIGGKPNIEPENDVVDTVEASKAKEEMAMFLSSSPGWIQLHDIMGVAFDDKEG